MSAKDRKHSNSEASKLFRAVVADVTPLKKRERATTSPQPNRPHRFARKSSTPADPRSVTDAQVAEVSPGGSLSFKRNSISNRVMRELRRGKRRVNAELDLHGLRIHEAAPELDEFIDVCCQRQLTLIRVIHGKGYGSGNSGPVLKAGVNQWLRQNDNVLAFCSATARDGGTGALYVLLRRR